MAEMARALNREGETARYEDRFRRVAAALRDAYVNDDGTIAGGTQTAYCVALHFGLLPDDLRPKAAAHLVADLEARDWHITTGFVGVSYICHVLTEAGYPEVAYRLLHQEGYPGWKYSILHGATTIWERWDGWTEEKGFQDVGMNSFNHYTLGSVGEWLRRRVAGIDTEGPGYRAVTIAPVMDRSLDFADGSYRAITGEIRSRWAWTDDGYRLEVTIPANVDATLTLPGAVEVTESGAPLTNVAGIRSVDTTDDATVVTTGSGTYQFEVRGVPPAPNA
jgi:alpha-L-rhamnosidase